MYVHLKKNQEFQNVYRNGKSFANRYLVMVVLKNEKTVNRFGISVSKKIGNSVIRNRIKRLIRESLRLNEERFRKGFDIVVVARTLARGKNYSEIEGAILHLGKIHHVL